MSNSDESPIRTYQDTKSENWVQWSVLTQGSALPSLQPDDVVVLSLRHERLLRLTQLSFLWHGPDIIFGVVGDVHGGHASGNSLVDLCLKATIYIWFLTCFRSSGGPNFLCGTSSKLHLP
jgi:hypothetical protein